MRPVRMLLLAIYALIGGHTPLSAQAADSLTFVERASIVDAVLTLNLELFAPSLKVDPCSIFLALGRDPHFAERLKPEVRSQLAGPVSESCREWKDVTRATRSGWILDEIKRQASDQLTLLATLWRREEPEGLAAETVYTAEYTLRKNTHGGAVSWYVHQVRLYDFVSYVYQ